MEAILLAVGEHYLGPLNEREIRMGSVFAGGVGGSYQNNCGVFTGGVMLIGALYGRNKPDQDDQFGQDLAADFQTRFLERFGTINCGQLREEKYGSGGAEPCAVLVERGAQTLIDLIEEQKQRKE